MARRRRVQGRREPGRIERKIYFYVVKRTQPLSVLEVFSRVAAIPPAAQLQIGGETDERRTLCSVSRCTWPIRVSLAVVRMSGIPAIMDHQGSEREIDLDDNEGLGEKTHFVFFEDGIVGCEMNFFGPRPEHLFAHLGKLEGVASLIAAASPSFDILLRNNVFDSLPAGAELTCIRVKVARSITEHLDRGQSALSDAILDAANCGQPEMIEIIVRGVPRSRSSFWDGAGAFVRTLLGLPDSRSHVKKLDIKAYDPAILKNVAVDLLSDRLVHVVDLLTVGERSRRLNDEDVYSAIEQGYAERSDELEAAATVTT